jgi:hypothetical protein
MQPYGCIEFDVTQEGQRTRLAFARRGFVAANQSYASATTRWAFYLLSSKQYLEIGEGEPNPDDIDP